MFAAHIHGGDRWREHLGWGKARHMTADLWDVKAAHAMKGSKKKPPLYPRPDVKRAAEGVPLMQMFRSNKRKGDV